MEKKNRQSCTDGISLSKVIRAFPQSNILITNVCSDKIIILLVDIRREMFQIDFVIASTFYTFFFNIHAKASKTGKD